MASATAPASAQVSCVQVGNAFVSQYYNVLHQSPQVVHRFYTDVSKLTRADAGPDGAVETVSTQHEIHLKVMSMEYGDFKAEIKTVDSQDSLNGGVLVMVTGALSSKSTGKRNFVQTFFLAPQEKGYFVLNDIFRYLDDGSELDKAPYGLANGISEPTVSPVPETEEQIVRESSQPLASEDEVLEEEPYVLAEPVEEPEPEDEVAETIEEAEVPPPVEEPAGPAPEASSPPQEDVQGEAPKKSYASILRMKESMGWSPVPAAKTAPVKTVSASADRSTASPPHVVTPPAAVTPPQETADENAPSDSEADKRAIYIKNLPMNIMEHQLEAEFKKFGQIKPGAIQVRTLKQQGYCYAFIEFEDQRAAQSALEASGLSIGGRPAYIEEKKATGTGVRGRYSERGSYRNEGGRGRGYYGGRGGDRDSGGRGGFGGRGGGRGYANSNDSGNANDEGFRRYDSQRPQRRAGGNRNGRSSTAAAAE